MRQRVNGMVTTRHRIDLPLACSGLCHRSLEILIELDLSKRSPHCILSITLHIA
jgi:hypothetical protein